MGVCLFSSVVPEGKENGRAPCAFAQFRLAVPLRPELPVALQNVGARLERNFGSDYLLTFLDDEMLIGRQTGSGGSFVFLRDPEPAPSLRVVV